MPGSASRPFNNQKRNQRPRVPNKRRCPPSEYGWTANRQLHHARKFYQLFSSFSGLRLDHGKQRQFILGGMVRENHSAMVSPISMGRIKSSSISALIDFWKSLILIPQAKAILTRLFGRSNTLRIFNISWSIRSSSSDTFPEHRKARMLKYFLIFVIQSSDLALWDGLAPYRVHPQSIWRPAY